MTGARAGFGALFKVGDGGGVEVFTTLAEVTNISPPSTSLETVDATHMESPDAFREKIATLLSAGEASLELNFLPSDTTHASLRADQIARTLRNFRISIPSSPVMRVAFSGFVAEVGEAIPLDDKMTMSVTITTTGKPVIESDV